MNTRETEHLTYCQTTEHIQSTITCKIMTVCIYQTDLTKT